jgi:chemotaxis protein MotB
MMRTRQRAKHGSHENSERWLLTYADLITLLLGLFVILYAMSKVDSEKYSKVMQALGGVFGAPAVMDGNQSVLPAHGALTEREDIANKVQSAMYEDLKSDLVTVSQDTRGVVVHLAEELLFASGKADLKSSSTGSLDLLAGVLKTLPNEIRVEGHTDNVPIHTPAFPSNWHLSVARAMNTADYLMTKRGLAPTKFNVVGYSEYKPLAPNTTAEDRAKNRRVDIVILSTESGQQAQQRKDAGG